VLCHVGIPGTAAGFIGVDVFFVLSGFLITGLLVNEHERTGRLDLRAFYARRARRIMPAALAVLAATLIAAQLVVSPLDVPGIADDVVAAGLSIANVRFAVQATDYFTSVGASPVLHYWSLGVEEQFYVAWPLIMLAAARIGRPRVSLAILAGTVLVASFVLSYELTTTATTWAYYSLPTRAWQLAAGGLLAIAAPSFRARSGALAPCLGWSGALCLTAALVLIGPETPYPGLVSLLPTIGALAIVAAGHGRWTPGSVVLERAPVRWLGRISYSLYLWHWPVLVLGSIALGAAGWADGSEVGLPARLGLAGLAVAVAWISWNVIEEPFRRARGWHMGQRRGLALAGAALATLIVAGTTMGAAAMRATASDDYDVGATPTDPDPFATPSMLQGEEPAGVVASSAPSAAPAASAHPAPQPAPPVAGLNRGSVPRNLTPTLGRARADHDPLVGDGCGLALAGTSPPACVYAKADAAITVALVGDSHAAQWFPALNRIARDRGWRLVPFTKFSCVFLDMPIWSPNLNREYTECATWREAVVRRLITLRPDLVVITSDIGFSVLDQRDFDPKRQGAAMARFVNRIPGSIAILVDTPRSDVDVPACLAMHRDAIERCLTSRAAALSWRHGLREREAARLTGATLVDLTVNVCPADPCPPIIGRTLVYRDNHHLTATFAASLARALAAKLPAVGVTAAQ